MEAAAYSVVIALGCYALVGVGYGVWFVVRAIGEYDDSARGSAWGFRLLILPGVAALWPLMEKSRRDRLGGRS